MSTCKILLHVKHEAKEKGKESELLAGDKKVVYNQMGKSNFLIFLSVLYFPFGVLAI
jgi:hypothetical protein